MQDQDRIYKAYPRKVGARAAKTAIARAIDRKTHQLGGPLMREQAVAQLLAATVAYAQATSRWTPKDRHFIPHPATWFNQDRFDDDPDEWRGRDKTFAEPDDGPGPVVVR